jgi:LPS sulfotransferase NodH
VTDVPAGALLGPALGWVDRHRRWRVLDRPVFVIAAPRSGSTALFDLLAVHPAFVSWPFEAHEAFERATPADHPVELGRRWPPAYAGEEMRRTLSRELYLGRLRARRRSGLPVRHLERLAMRRIRLLEKTPANVLRVEVLAEVFPDASFVFLHRDATSNIASLIEAWETPSAAHATVNVAGRTVQWMMLAPEGWPDYVDADVPTRAAFQWRSANETALDALQQLPADRWTRLSYENFVADPRAAATEVLDWLGVGGHPAVLAAAERLAHPGRTSFSPPRPDKWRERAHLIEPLLPQLSALRSRLGYPA